MAILSQGQRFRRHRSVDVRYFADRLAAFVRIAALRVNAGGSQSRDLAMSDVEEHLARARRHRERFEERRYHAMYMTWQ
jgi:hypothetical protein